MNEEKEYDVNEAGCAIQNLIELCKERMGPEQDEQEEDLEILQKAEALVDKIDETLAEISSALNQAQLEADESDWERAGEVGVDSGQLMVCDPCYIRSEWMGPDEESDLIWWSSVFRHKDGRVLYCKMHAGGPELPDDAIGFDTYETPIPEYGGKTANALRQEGLIEAFQGPEPSGEFSYTGCCEATRAGGQVGQLNYRRGHAGAGVAFSSGMGDGCYEVFVRHADLGEWGRRVAEVRIVMVGKEEEEETKRFMQQVLENSGRNIKKALTDTEK